MKFYANLDENNVCIVVSQLSGEKIQPNMIEIESLNTDYMWKKYENGGWSTEKFEPERLTQPSLEERIESVKQDNLIIMDALATVFEEILNLQAMQGGTV